MTVQSYGQYFKIMILANLTKNINYKLYGALQTEA